LFNEVIDDVLGGDFLLGHSAVAFCTEQQVTHYFSTTSYE